MANIYDINGNVIPVGGGEGSAINYDKTVKAINHRGYNTVAPENTLPAFKLSKQMGFNYVECDVLWTADDVAVLCHNDDISYTSNGTGNISEMTYAELLQYDFCKGKPEYAGTKIPTAEQFLVLCRAIGLHPYIEIKHNEVSTTEARITALVALVNKCGMRGNVTYIGFNPTDLGYVHAADSEARLGVLRSAGGASSGVISTVTSLSSGGKNQVFIGANYNGQTAEDIQSFVSAGIPLEQWTVNSADVIKNADPYITGFTSDTLIAGKILYDENIG